MMSFLLVMYIVGSEPTSKTQRVSQINFHEFSSLIDCEAAVAEVERQRKMWKYGSGENKKTVELLYTSKCIPINQNATHASQLNETRNNNGNNDAAPTDHTFVHHKRWNEK